MLTQFLSAPPTPRVLYLSVALALVLSGLAIVPMQRARGAGESVETSALTSAGARNASSHDARERRDYDHWGLIASSPTMQLFAADTKLALLAFFSEDNRSSVSHSTTPLRTNARSFHSYSAAPFIPPTISLTTPTNNANFIAGATITLSANALDSDGTISKVEFFRGAVKLGEDTTAPYAYDWTNVAAGDYVLTARATDNAGEITTSAAINISVLAQVKQYVGWSAITNGIDLGNGSVRKTSSGAWDFYSGSLQTLLAGDGYFESTAATYNQSINLGGTDGSGRAVVIGSGGWVGIYENNVLVAATSSNPPVPIISAHIAGDRYRIEITNSILRYIRYRSSAREVMFTSTATLPVYPISVGLGMSPQNAEWQKTVLAQLTQKATWSSITNGISLGNGSVKKTSTGVWDFSANAAQTLLRGDGYFESTASMYNQSINLSGTDGASRSLVIGSGGWAAVYENGAEITTVVPHAAGDRYRVEISNGSLRYVRYRSGIRSVLYTSTNGLPAYPMSLGLGASPQNAEWQNTIIAQLSQTVAWSYINNGIDLGNGSVRKTSAGVWDFSAGPRQQLVCGNGYFESTASSFNHSISLGGVGGDGAIVAGTGGWAAIYEMGQEVANTYPMQNIAPHAAGDRYRLEISRNKLRYVRYRAGVRTLMFTSNNPVPGYALGFGLGASWQDTEWQNTIFSDNMPEHNDASFVSQTVPTTMVPGQTYSVSVTMRNTGASTWTPDGDYQLASENLPDNQRWGLNRVNLTTTVLPGSDATFNFTVTAPATGSHSFQWRMVQQGVERFGTLSTNVTVQTVNNPPTVSLSSPMNNQVFTAGTTVQLAANASDTGGSITKVEFFQGTTKLGEDTTSPYTYNWTNVPAGSYVLTARATDNGGATATSNAVNITVNTPNVPPTVTIAAPTNNATFANDTTITITANAVDSDGIVNKVEFFRGGTTKLGEDTNGTDGFSYSWANVQAGPYSLTVKATDNSGAITTSSGVSITVSLPVVSVASTDADASEPGSNTGVFTVSRTGGTSMQLTVNFSVSGTAVAGTDYTSVGTAVTIPIGAASRTIVITPIDDTAIEGNETATLTVSSNAAYTLGTPTSATVTIADNDHYTPIVSITSPVGGATFTTPATINITANASEQNGTISKVEFFQGATKLGEDTNGADGFSYAWTNVPDGSYSLTARATDSYGVAVTSAAVQVNVLNFNLARLDPLNRTGGSGEDPLSRNFNWSVGLVGLSGRAGLDLGLSLAYNSLVWTKSGSYIAFDNDRGFPSPGFRLGFPVIQPAYNNSEVGKQAFLLITPDGSHTELRQVGTSSFYESADSSHLLLDASDGNTMILRTTDGTQLSYAWQGSDFQCTQIKDRNGNFISINYTGFGRIDTVVDTLARTIKFNYDGSNYLTSITQTWTVNGLPQTHTWASFNYSNPNILIQTNFTGLTNLGPQNGSTLKVLTRATLSDNSHYNFEYTSWGQVWKISEYAPDNNLPPDSHLLNYRAYNLRGSPMQPTGTEPDCPRFTERHDWAENWNRSGSPGSAGLPAGPEQEVITNYSVPPSGSWTMPDGTSQTGTIAQVTLPDNTYHKMYFAGSAGTSSGWQRGLPMLVETYDSEGVRQRQAATLWTQDNTTVSYLLNPRVLETNTYDPAGNRARLSVTYQSANFADGTSCRLPQDVYEYQANATTVLRRTHTDYNLATTYTDRRIIGLASEKRLYEVDPNTQAETLMSKVGFAYDAGSIQGNDAPVQHDNANYAQGFTTGRANLTSVTRFDVNNTLPSTTSTMTYNTSGSVVKTIDPANHQVLISYTDQFAANGTTLDAARPATCAFPTMVTDPDGFTVSSRYHYDFGAATWKQTPQPNTTVNLPGPEQTLTYDSIGRIQRTTNLVNGAYTRYVYPGTQPGSQNRLDVYSRILDEANEQNGLEAHSFSIADGHGRTIASASSHPGSVGGFSGQLILYDAMGRAIKSSNPAETSASGTPTQWAVAGDDASPTGLGWLYTQQTYDWKGRPLVTTNTDLTTKEASYGGCGCAGGQVVTLTDEGTIDGGVPKRRQQKIYADVLGRTVKTEVLNWQGGTAYATTVNTYNARDQVTLVRQYAGAEGSATYQDTTMAYDGYGRLKTKHVPQQNTNSVTTYNYNDDDTVLSVVDGRGATCTYGYNNRHQVTSVAHTLSGYDPINIGYVYDAAGNRTSMSHSVNSVAKDSAAYVYDQLSRMTSETRHINALEGSSPNYGNFTMGYGYTLSSELQSVTDAFSSTTNLSYDVAGRTQSVSGSYGGTNYTYASNVGYRAWGAVKAATFGDNTSQSVPQFNARMQPTQFRLTNGNRYDYSYYDDGRLKQLTDLDDQVGDPHTVQFHYMSRSYQYDQAARIAGVGPMSPNPNSVPAPFTGNYGYDEFNNMTSRSGHYALNSDRYDPGPNWDSPPATYTNNRRVQSGWAYDADGRVTTSSDTSDAGGSSTRTWIYDAAGELITVSETRNGTTTTNSMAYDGDGQLLYESVSGATSDYLIRSAVLGTVLTKLDATGNKNTTYVPTNGLVAAMQQKDYQGNPTMSWVHRDASGLQETGKAYDPFGNLIPNVQPPVVGPPPYMPFYGATYGGASWNSFTNANNFSGGCNSAANNNPALCNDRMLELMGAEFVSNLPGQHDDMWQGENDHISRLNGPHDDPNNNGGAIWLPPDDSIPGRFGNWALVAGHVRKESMLPQEPNIPPLRLTDPTKELRLKHSFSDARNVLTTKGGNAKTKAAIKKCLDFFTQGISVDEALNILENFGATASYDYRLGESTARTANSGGKMAATVRLGDPFFADDNIGIKGTGLTWNPQYNVYVTMQNLTPRQNRSLTILHEFAHALGLLPHDGRDVDPTGKMSAQNDATIFEKCGDLIDAIVPWRD